MVLFVALGAMAQEATTTTYDFEDGNKVFTDDSRITSSIVAESGYDGTSALLFTCAHNAGNGYSFSHFDISSLLGNPKTVTISFQYYNAKDKRAILTIGDANVRGTTGNSSRATYNEKGAIFALGGIRASSKDWSYLNGKKFENGYLSDKWLDVTVTVNVIEKKHSYSIKDSETGTVLESGQDVAYFSSDALECTQIDLFGRENNSQCARIDNLSITVEQDVRAYADYTVKYVDESGTAIKDAAVYNGAVGDAISLVEADKISFKNNDNTKKYIYKSNDANGKTIAEDGSTVVTVTFREAATWNYTANAVDKEGNVLRELGNGSNFEGETARVSYNQYIFKGGVLYEKKAGESYNNEFNWAFTLDENNKIAKLVYDKSSQQNVVYFGEVEEIEGMTDVTSGNANIRCSNSVGAYNASETPVEVLTLTPGTYTITAQIWGNARKETIDGVETSIPVPLYVNCGDETLEVGTLGYITSGSKEFTITENAKVTIPQAGSAGSSPRILDWILIQSAEANSLLVAEEGKDLDVEGNYASATYTRKIEAGKYGTICLPFAPDVASLENYTFFKMESAEDGALNFVVDEAPVANKPYIYSLNEDKEATAITGAATEVSATTTDVEVNGWIMKGSFTNQTIDATTGNYYGLSSGTIVKANKTLTVKPYRAYFTSATGESAVALRFTRGDETTEISAAELDVQPATVIYDLAGRRVEKMEKGIYIVNGKKVIR